MLKCWSCQGGGATNVAANGWGTRCTACGGSGHAGCMQLAMMFLFAVFGCLLMPPSVCYSVIALFLPVPMVVAGILAFVLTIAWYVFFFWSGAWRRFSVAAGLGFLWIAAAFLICVYMGNGRPGMRPNPPILPNPPVVVQPPPVVITDPPSKDLPPPKDLPSPKDFPPPKDAPPPKDGNSPAGRATIHVLFTLSSLQRDEDGRVQIGGVDRKWKLPSGAARDQDMTFQLPAPGKYKYTLSSMTTALLAGQVRSVSTHGEGEIDAADGRRFVYVLDASRGANNIVGALRPAE